MDANLGTWWHPIVFGFFFGFGFAAGTMLFNALLGLIKK